MGDPIAPAAPFRILGGAGGRGQHHNTMGQHHNIFGEAGGGEAFGGKTAEAAAKAEQERFEANEAARQANEGRLAQGCAKEDLATEAARREKEKRWAKENAEAAKRKQSRSVLR